MESVLSIMDELTQELIEEGTVPPAAIAKAICSNMPPLAPIEKAILCQYSQQLYEENQRFSESMLLSAAADSMAPQSELICPICQRYPS